NGFILIKCIYTITWLQKFIGVNCTQRVYTGSPSHDRICALGGGSGRWVGGGRIRALGGLRRRDPGAGVAAAGFERWATTAVTTVFPSQACSRAPWTSSPRGVAGAVLLLLRFVASVLAYYLVCRACTLFVDARLVGWTRCCGPDARARCCSSSGSTGSARLCILSGDLVSSAACIDSVVLFDGPGAVSKNWRHDAEDSGDPSLPASEEQGSAPRYCFHCQNGKPPRCHHCFVCKSSFLMTITNLSTHYNCFESFKLTIVH
ncbi:uncharacterized protein LOC133895920, partial [Phragmites australis]|uniref:uncharacterized protein LOC133895920 n=1 Tax=Phragmites australis TaxID=29695 RepID=UPI002D77FC49